MAISAELLEILICPACRAKVELKPDGSREAQIEIDEASGPIYLLWKRPQPQR